MSKKGRMSSGEVYLRTAPFTAETPENSRARAIVIGGERRETGKS
jgi:hypothetical protein